MVVAVYALSPEPGIVGYSQGRVCTSLPRRKCRAWTRLTGPALLSGDKYQLAHCLWPFLTCHCLDLLPSVLPSTSPQTPPSGTISDYKFSRSTTVRAALLLLALAPACSLSLSTTPSPRPTLICFSRLYWCRNNHFKNCPREI